MSSIKDSSLWPPFPSPQAQPVGLALAFVQSASLFISASQNQLMLELSCEFRHSMVQMTALAWNQMSSLAWNQFRIFGPSIAQNHPLGSL